MVMRSLTVTLPQQSYPIYIGFGCLANHELLRQHLLAKQLLIVTNETVAPLYLAQVQDGLASYDCDVVILPDGETHKNLANLQRIYEKLLSNHHHRDTSLVALGGGVIGDITGFAAATYQRGVGLIQIPTTLLAQVDASVGGKTAINHPLGKNMIGSFYQPNAVIMDLATLASLPEREFRAGFAEIIKYAVLVGGDFVELVKTVLAQTNQGSSSHQLALLIEQCCLIKSRFVQSDEREMGERALLNLGHTMAHALEAHTQYQRWLHGEAVAIGLYCAALLSYHNGLLDAHDLALIDSLLAMAQLPRRIPRDLDLLSLCEWMRRDKKIKNGQLRFILIRGMGDCFLDTSVSEAHMFSVLTEAVEGEAL